MMNDWKLSTNEKPVRVACERCVHATSHDVVARYSFDDANAEMNWGESFEIVSCRGCERVSFRKTSWNSEDVEYDFQSGGYSAAETEELYPNRRRTGKSIERHHLPARVRAVYDETLAAANSDHRILGGIGIRALVEAVCAEEKATGANLEKRIDNLVTLGKLTKEGAEILHGTRILGNAAAHEAVPASADTFDAALAVAEHLLHTAYVLPSIAAKLPKARGKSPIVVSPTASAAKTKLGPKAPSVIKAAVSRPMAKAQENLPED